MNYKTKRGFTLIEVLAVVILIGVLATISFPAVLNVYNDVKIKAMRLAENNLKNSAKMYIEDCYGLNTKENLNGCAYADVNADSGYVFVTDMVYDQYTEPVSFDDNSCTGYVEYNYDDYTVCLDCAGAYITPDPQCTFDYVDTKITSLDFTGSSYHTFNTPKKGNYRIELWGAHGGGSLPGGDGAYTSGVIKLNLGQKLYLYIGGTTANPNATSYNGGFSSSGGWPGGGASDVRLVSGDWDNSASVASRIMVAAGGGSGNLATGASGGGVVGYSGGVATGGTQLSGGAGSNGFTAGVFNKGGNGCGGGSGYYGGGGASCSYGAAGGSSYISGHAGCVGIISSSLQSPKTGCLSGTTSVACSHHYSNKIFTTTVMIDGNGYLWTNVRKNQQSMPSKIYGGYYNLGEGNNGNGYARITYMGV